MDTALEAILRVMLNSDEMIESNGDLNDYYLIFGYCVFDAKTRTFISEQYADTISAYGDPFVDVAKDQVIYATMNDAGIIDVYPVDSLAIAERVHTSRVAEYERFDAQCESCGKDHNETAICER